VLFEAIARSGSDRGRVSDALRGTRVRGGIVGDFSFDGAGDTTLRAITVSQAAREFRPVTEVNPSPSLVARRFASACPRVCGGWKKEPGSRSKGPQTVRVQEARTRSGDRRVSGHALTETGGSGYKAHLKEGS